MTDHQSCSADSAIQAILEGWFGEAIEHMDDGKRVRKFLLEPLIKAASSCGAESNRHSGAVGAEKRAEQSNPGGGHEVTDSNSQHENRDKPLPDEPTPAAGRLMPNDAQPQQEPIGYAYEPEVQSSPKDYFIVKRTKEAHYDIPVYAAQPPAAPVETCPSCDGSGLALNMSGEPDECRECKGNTVIPRSSAAAPVETGYNLATGERDNEETDPTYFHCSAGNESLAAVRRYVEMRDAQPLKGLDETIHAIHTGTDFAAELRLPDLRAVLALITHLPQGAHK